MMAFFTACKKDEAAGSLTLNVSNMVGNEVLELSRPVPYRTLAGDEFTVTTFRYYLSNIKLKKADGSEFVQPESYYLLDEALPASKSITISNVPAGTYTSVAFTIGVDSARNVTGPRTGALEPSDMLWVWNTGYINTKLEGRSPQSPNTAIIFHVVGFSSPTNTIRSVAPSLNGSALQIGQGRTAQLQIRADILKMFSGPHPIRFASIYNVMGGANAKLLADNQAADMFTVSAVGQ
ncbi:MbnP family protein [Hymenobacter puniceus]|uniref:MbnP family protein n=1 Tax=Hymenobacter sp. BT190 TaxID=2763505 RepID=UPI00165103ED|nr:MbnP family protein [Hymenobacter sp. BT190]MBC6698138.1 hypothetical protein [Hymenobacter sp. BT190]